VRTRTASEEGTGPAEVVRADDLERSEVLARTILRNLPGSAVLLLDRDLRVRLAEGPALEELGWRTEGVRRRSLGDLLSGDTGRELPERLQAALDGRPCSFEIPLGERSHSVRAVPVIGPADEVVGVLAVSVDVTERRRAEQSLRASEHDFRLLTENSTDVVSRHDPEARLVYASPSSATVFGLDPAEITGRSSFDLVHPDDAPLIQGTLREMQRSGRGRTLSFRLRRGDGSFVWVETSCRVVRDPDSGELGELHCVTRDISDRKRAEAELERLLAQQSAVAALGEQALEDDDLGRLLRRVCSTVEMTLGVEACGVMRLTGEGERVVVEAGTGWLAEQVGRVADPTVVDESKGLVECLIEGPTITEDLSEEDRFEAPLLERAGVTSTINVLIGHAGLSYGILGAYSSERRSFTLDDANFLQAVGHVLGSAIERRRSEDRARHDALHDPLTGMPNRSLLLDRLAQALVRCERNGTQLALLFLDIDNFKLINDSLGHSAGDELLEAVAPRLAASVRPSDTVARFGGDEFVVLAEDVSDENAARLLTERIARAFAAPFVLRGESHVVSASTGVVMCAGGDVEPEDLLRDADAAMYRAKERGRGHYEVFDDAMRARVVDRLKTENELRRALADDEIEVHYQPYYSLSDGAIAGVEALARWRHPERGLLLPGEFIPVAEESGLIVQLGAIVLRRACHDACQWRRACSDASGVRLTVNLSPRQAAQPGLVEVVASALADSGLDPSCLGVEITEGIVMEEATGQIEALEGLRELGVRLVVDDFGTGYSSLAYLPRFSLDVLKIDRSFVAGLDSGDGSEAIVAAIVGMASALGLPVIPEGIETEDQLAKLTELGCGFGQGFLFSRPVKASEIERMLTAGLAVA
jgi:diguanylate cyclase (GGDEF)-like protein/PAS domain S-box-containing protein